MYVVFVTANFAANAPKEFTPPPPTAPIRSYAEFGLYTNTLYDNVGWGTANWFRVVRHETGHVFWACDEYNCTSTCLSCYHNSINGFYPVGFGPRPNAHNGNCDVAGACPIASQDCMMKTNHDFLCPDTAIQIGW